MASLYSETERRVERNRKRIKNIISKLQQGTVVVEGKHDKLVMGKLGVGCITFDKLIKNNDSVDSRIPVYILVDNDRSGKIKREEAIESLLDLDRNYKIDLDLGLLLLKIAKRRRVEEIYKPINEILDS